MLPVQKCVPKKARHHFPAYPTDSLNSDAWVAAQVLEEPTDELGPMCSMDGYEYIPRADGVWQRLNFPEVSFDGLNGCSESILYKLREYKQYTM